MDPQDKQHGKLPVTIRPATRADIPALARLQFVAFPKFPMVPHLLPGLRAHPEEYLWTTTLGHRSFLVSPDLYVFVAEDPHTGETLGYTLWWTKNKAAPPRQWSDERGRRWWHPLESLLMDAESTYHKYVYDRIVNQAALSQLIADDDKAIGEYEDVPHLHLRHIVVSPEAQGRGVGRALLGHGLKAAGDCGLPVSLLCAAPQAQILYDKTGFRELGAVHVGKGTGSEVVMPAMIWEPPSRS